VILQKIKIKMLTFVNIYDKEDVGTSTFPGQVKAITLMRYIRKAIKNEELVKF